MSLIPLAAEFNSRTGTPRQSLTNLYAEATPQGPRAYSLRNRAGLDMQYSAGSGPVWCVVQLGFVQYILSGNEVYRHTLPNTTTLIGTVATGGTKQAAFSETQLVIVSGGNAYVIEYTTTPTVMTQITDPDLPSVSGVAFSTSRFLYPQTDSGTYYFSDINDATSIDGLAFANAEADPDPIARVAVLGDQPVFFGTDSLEFHSPTSDPNAPFQRSPGQTQDKGCIAAYSVVNADNSLFWIGQDQGSGRIVYRSTGGGVAIRVSNNSIEAALQADSGANAVLSKAFSVVMDGHTFYVVSVPNVGSYALDIGENKWAEWASYGLTTFRITASGGALVGDHLGNIYSFDASLFDDDGDPIVRVASAFISVQTRTKCNVLILECAMGVSTAMGQGSDAVVEHRYTDQGEGDFTPWESVSLGLIGDRTGRANWAQLGTILPPGRLDEFRWSDPVLSVPYGIRMNVRP